ncbi:MAG: A/G-specific adenine glycosylase [Xenococcaceae cyanobacterium]
MKSTITQSEKQLTQLVTNNQIKWYRCQLDTWSKKNFRNFPWRRTTDAYTIFVAEFLLQRTDAVTVTPIYKDFIARYPTIQDLASAKVEEVAELLKPLGLFFRADRICQSAQIILKKYNNKIPQEEQKLLELPGVGIYTARSICTNAFGQPLAILDTNVARILERFFGLKGERVKSRCKILWKAAEISAPTQQVSRWNLTLLDFGALVCTARNPNCDRCPLAKQCHYLNRS